MARHQEGNNTILWDDSLKAKGGAVSMKHSYAKPSATSCHKPKGDSSSNDKNVSVTNYSNLSPFTEPSNHVCLPFTSLLFLITILHKLGARDHEMVCVD